jgi:predicted lipid-binding transport protein (Tim44 family)
MDQGVMAIAGRRGSRSGAKPVRPPSPTAVDQSPPPPVAVSLPATPRMHAGREWIGPAVGLAIGALLSLLSHERIGIGYEGVVLGAAGTAAAVWVLLHRRAKHRLPPPAAVAPRTRDEPPPVPPTDLDNGVWDIRRTDRGFDAARFAGYAGMMFRDVQSAGMARDVAGLRHRVTPAMYVELQARCDRLRSSGRSVRVAAVEISAEVTEAWQEGDRDYVTTYVAGSMLRHTIDDATGEVVDGSPTKPVAVEAFLTFTRPAGLNFWMLSLVQGE